MISIRPGLVLLILLVTIFSGTLISDHVTQALSTQTVTSATKKVASKAAKVLKTKTKTPPQTLELKRAKRREYYYNNKEMISKIMKKYYLKHREKRREYYMKNKAKITEKKRIWYLKNKERIKANKKQPPNKPDKK